MINAAAKATLEEFRRWITQHGYARGSELSYWIDAYVKDDGKDMYGKVLPKR